MNNQNNKIRVPKPDIYKYSVGTASIYARFSDNYQMTTKAKAQIKWAFYQFMNNCLKNAKTVDLDEYIRRMVGVSHS